MIGYILLILLKCEVVLAMLTSANQSAEQSLLADLLRYYNPAALPSQNTTDGSQQVTVYITLQLSKMDGINAKEQTFAASGWRTTEWIDHRLSWDPAEYGGIEQVFLPPDAIWLPRFTLDNSARESQYDEDMYRWFWAVIHSDGWVEWEPGGSFKSECSIDVKLFPFDHQICELVFANWIYNGNLVNLTFSGEDELLETYAESGEWDILEYKVWGEDFYYVGYPDPYPEIHYKLHLRRKSLYFAVNVILPSVFWSLLVLMIYRLPPGSGEKIGMGVTLLLSHSVFLLMISENLPATSDGIPILVIYLITFMWITSITVALSVLVLHFYHHDGLQHPSHRLKVIMLKLARIVGYQVGNLRLNTQLDHTTTGDNNKHISSTTESSDNNRNVVQQKRMMSNKNKIAPLQQVREATLLSLDEEDTGYESLRNNYNDDTLVSILRLMLKHDKSIADTKDKAAARHEWKEIAIIVDRVCFWSSVLILLLVSLFMLGIWPFVASKAQF